MNQKQQLKTLDAIDELEIDGRMLRARGLLHLLALAYINSDGDESHIPTEDEKEGIMWLSMQVGEDLKSAVASAIESKVPAARADETKSPEDETSFRVPTNGNPPTNGRAVR